LREPSIWSIAVYRYGSWIDEAPLPEPARWVAKRSYWLAFRAVELVTGISFTTEVEIGPGLRIWHFGGIFIHGAVRIGSECTLRQGVTVGEREEGGPVPVLADRVDVGAYAQILGDVHVGEGARIGAMSVVLRSVPAGAVAVGNPARIVEDPELDG
jgi:serine O-acetyltransferase